MRRAHQPLTSEDRNFHPSAYAAVQELRRLRVPVVACGQTVFWDEPVKVVLSEILDTLAPEVEMWLGIHDTDYFSRGAPSMGKEGCLPLPHNDFSTRDLWAAAGETSLLFGGEVVPSHDDLARAGVSLEKAARAAEQGKAEFLDSITEAWGWRGLAYVGAEHPVAGQMPLSQLWEALLGLVRWGLDTSSNFLASNDARRNAEQVKELIIGWVSEWEDRRSQATLVELYQRLLPRFCSLLLGREPENLHYFNSSEFFHFNPTTAQRPRFSPLGLFLNPKTATAARRAYDSAVRGSGIYELDRFGPGALPFNIVAPGRGRGTLFVTPSSVRVGFEPGEVTIPTSPLADTAQHLANLLQAALGKGISLVGKAVVLPLMFCSEFVMALHQGASVYIPLTRQMHHLLHEQGLGLPLYPLLRLRYHTWASLSATDVSFRLPLHLAAAFQREQITARDFAATWEEVVGRQEALLEHLQRLKTPEELLAYLSTREAAWKTEAEQWGNAHRTLHEIGEWVKCYKMEAQSLATGISRLNADVAELERRKGDLRRQEIDVRDEASAAPTAPPHGASVAAQFIAPEGEDESMTNRSYKQRQELTDQIRARRAAVRQKKAALKQVLAALDQAQNTDQAVAARKTIAHVEARAELAKARLARDALIVQGLTRANLRPTAWWFPLVDPDNLWFRQVVRTTELYFEEFDSP